MASTADGLRVVTERDATRRRDHKHLHRRGNATATTVNAIARYPFNPARRRARVKAYAMAALRRKCLVVDAGLD